MVANIFLVEGHLTQHKNINIIFNRVDSTEIWFWSFIQKKCKL